MNTKEIFVRKGTNAGAVNAGIIYTVEHQKNAGLLTDTLPHNAFTIANLNTNCTIFIYLDDMQNQNKPDYILFPSSAISVIAEEGIRFTTLFIKNSDGVNNISANEIKWRISTVKEGF